MQATCPETLFHSDQNKLLSPDKICCRRFSQGRGKKAAKDKDEGESNEILQMPTAVKHSEHELGWSPETRKGQKNQYHKTKEERILEKWKKCNILTLSSNLLPRCCAILTE